MTNDTLIKYFTCKSALEIGGPSQLLTPYYPRVCNITLFNHEASMSRHSQGTLESKIIFGDATKCEDFKPLNGEKFDLIILSHTFEHIANPIKALKIWTGLLTDGGVIINIVPDKNHCWDRCRPYTDLQHIVDDYEHGVTENDLTHIDESSCMLETRPNYYSDIGNDNENRIIHHHVYSANVLSQVHELAKFKTIECDNLYTDPLQLIYIGKYNYE
jgi:SAM-dependent methyltransferase